MVKIEQDYKKRCKAMISAKVEDPESKEGIDFCVNCCPYKYCVVFETIDSQVQLRARGRKQITRALRAHRVSVDDIALILGVSVKNVQRYLKQ